MATVAPTYTLAEPVEHTCWTGPHQADTLVRKCPGCDTARQHPCQHCGFGHIFSTHSDEAHRDNGDPIPHRYRTPDGNTCEAWHNSPHIHEPGR